MDCLGFVKSVYATLGKQRTIPSFSSRPEELERIDIRPFEECAVGDVLFFRQRDLPADTKRRQRVFTHVGVKYGDAEVAHLSQKEGLTVESLKQVLEERVLVSRENVGQVIWDEEQKAFVMPGC